MKNWQKKLLLGTVSLAALTAPGCQCDWSTPLVYTDACLTDPITQAEIDEWCAKASQEETFCIADGADLSGLIIPADCLPFIEFEGTAILDNVTVLGNCGSDCYPTTGCSTITAADHQKLLDQKPVGLKIKGVEIVGNTNAVEGETFENSIVSFEDGADLANAKIICSYVKKMRDANAEGITIENSRIEDMNGADITDGSITCTSITNMNNVQAPGVTIDQAHIVNANNIDTSGGSISNSSICTISGTSTLCSINGIVVYSIGGAGWDVTDAGFGEGILTGDNDFRLIDYNQLIVNASTLPAGRTIFGHIEATALFWNGVMSDPNASTGIHNVLNTNVPTATCGKLPGCAR